MEPKKNSYEKIYDVVKQIPCYHVVNREDRLSDAFAFDGVNRQKLLLET